MFFDYSLLNRRSGKFSLIWLIANDRLEYRKKTDKNFREVMNVDVPRVCEDILRYICAQVPPSGADRHRPRFSLYLSAMLMAGSVRVHRHQVVRLLSDAAAAFERLMKTSYVDSLDMEPGTVQKVTLMVDPLAVVPTGDFGQLGSQFEMDPLLTAAAQPEQEQAEEARAERDLNPNLARPSDITLREERLGAQPTELFEDFGDPLLPHQRSLDPLLELEQLSFPSREQLLQPPEQQQPPAPEQQQPPAPEEQQPPAPEQQQPPAPEQQQPPAPEQQQPPQLEPLQPEQQQLEQQMLDQQQQMLDQQQLEQQVLDQQTLDQRLQQQEMEEQQQRPVAPAERARPSSGRAAATPTATVKASEPTGGLRLDTRARAASGGARDGSGSLLEAGGVSLLEAGDGQPPSFVSVRAAESTPSDQTRPTAAAAAAAAAVAAEAAAAAAEAEGAAVQGEKQGEEPGPPPPQETTLLGEEQMPTAMQQPVQETPRRAPEPPRAADRPARRRTPRHPDVTLDEPQPEPQPQPQPQPQPAPADSQRESGSSLQLPEPEPAAGPRLGRRRRLVVDRSTQLDRDAIRRRMQEQGWDTLRAPSAAADRAAAASERTAPAAALLARPGRPVSGPLAALYTRRLVTTVEEDWPWHGRPEEEQEPVPEPVVLRERQTTAETGTKSLLGSSDRESATRSRSSASQRLTLAGSSTPAAGRSLSFIAEGQERTPAGGGPAGDSGLLPPPQEEQVPQLLQQLAEEQQQVQPPPEEQQLLQPPAEEQQQQQQLQPSAEEQQQLQPPPEEQQLLQPPAEEQQLQPTAEEQQQLQPPVEQQEKQLTDKQLQLEQQQMAEEQRFQPPPEEQQQQPPAQELSSTSAQSAAPQDISRTSTAPSQAEGEEQPALSGVLAGSSQFRSATRLPADFADQLRSSAEGWVAFTDLAPLDGTCTRLQAAATFSHLLQLHAQRQLRLQQIEPYRDILVYRA